MGEGNCENNILQQQQQHANEEIERLNKEVVTMLHAKLDPGNQTLSALDFHHAVQKDSEAVADYIRHLERTFQIGFGRDKMSMETQKALLYGQLQSGLAFELSKAPAVSGVLNKGL